MRSAATLRLWVLPNSPMRACPHTTCFLHYQANTHCTCNHPRTSIPAPSRNTSLMAVICAACTQALPCFFPSMQVETIDPLLSPSLSVSPPQHLLPPRHPKKGAPTPWLHLTPCTGWLCAHLAASRLPPTALYSWGCRALCPDVMLVSSALHPLPCTLCPAPCALCLPPCALCPVPCALCPVPCALCPVPAALSALLYVPTPSQKTSWPELAPRRQETSIGAHRQGPCLNFVRRHTIPARHTPPPRPVLATFPST
jgi:hypothetical protein